MIGERVPITRDSLDDKLVHNRRETGNVIEKGEANRDAAELVRKEGEQPGSVAGIDIYLIISLIKISTG